jgi:hypothetical protein
MPMPVELCELFAQKTGNWVSRAAMCRYLQKLELNRKKKHGTVAKLRQKESKNREWTIGIKSRISSHKTSVFLEETGIFFSLIMAHSRSPYGTRVAEIKPFYRGQKSQLLAQLVWTKC